MYQYYFVQKLISFGSHVQLVQLVPVPRGRVRLERLEIPLSALSRFLSKISFFWSDAGTQRNRFSLCLQQKGTVMNAFVVSNLLV